MTKPAGCFLQVIAIPLVIVGIVQLANGAITAGIVWLVIAGFLLWAGGQPSRA